MRPLSRLLGDLEGCLFLTLSLSCLGELSATVQNCADLLIGQTEGIFNLLAGYRTCFSDELRDLFNQFGILSLCLCRLCRLVLLPVVKQFQFVSAETYDFRIIGADRHNLFQHFSLCHNHHLLPFLDYAFSIQHFSHVVKPFWRIFYFFYSNSFSLGNQADWRLLIQRLSLFPLAILL